MDTSHLKHNPLAEEIVDILCKKTQNANPKFFRLSVNYYFSVLAATMRASIKTKDRGVIPINMYALNLATSGFGKGFSSNIIEEEFIHLFRRDYLEQTLPVIANRNLAKLSIKRASIKGTDIADEEVEVEKEYLSTGTYLFSFDSGTSAAFKQARHKLLMCDIGALNFTCDEIGSNLVSNTELLTTYLEAFDKGKVKNKLLKNTSDNKRVEEIEGKVPTNMLLFGTQDKLLKGDKTEDELMAMLETGYGRRCFFGYSTTLNKDDSLTAEQIYDILTAGNMDIRIKTIADDLCRLAAISEYNTEIEVSREISIKAIAYRLNCEKRADQLGEHDGIRKAELGHRYFKALKLAGAYAFIEGASSISEDHFNAAIKLAEESGEAFNKILTRDKPYVRLAKYIASLDHEITSVDLIEELPSYKGSASHRADLLQLATAWGYGRQILIKKSYRHGIEFISADTLEETDIDQVVVSYSQDLAVGYRNEVIPFGSIDQLLLQKGFHWVNHHLKDGHRTESNAEEGFNLVVLDVDKGTTLEQVRLLLKPYKFFIHTTKRHNDKVNRFRIVMPMNFKLKLTKEDFKQFMLNLFEWLPFSVDDATAQRARKWETFPSVEHFFNEGELLDVLPFIPHTQKNAEFQTQIDSHQSLSNLERWFIMNTGKGNRSNRLIRYALLLVDSGRPIDVVRTAVHDLNNKLSDKLSAAEIDHTIMTTASKRSQEKYSE